MTGLRVVLQLGVLLSVLGCGGAAHPSDRTPQRGIGVSQLAPSEFSYVIPGAGELSADSLRGRVSLVALIATDDFASQLLVKRLEELLHTHTPRINAAAVALDPPRNVELVKFYPASLGLSFPVAIADAALLDGNSPFGRLSQMPCVAVLDANGGLASLISEKLELPDLEKAVQAAERRR